MTKSAGNFGFGHIYWRNPSWKTSCFVQCLRNYHRYLGQWKTISICESIITFHYVIHNFQLAKFSRWISFYWRSDGFPLTWSMDYHLKSSLFQENRARQIFRKTIIMCAYQGVIGKFGALCFLETSVLKFALLPYYRGSPGYIVNPFSANVPLLYPLKISENRRFSVFRGYRNGTLVENWLKLNS